MAAKKTKTDLKEILDKIPQDKQLIAAELVEELTFMRETLSELKKQIKASGTVEHFEQGSQSFLRESPALKAYNTTVQRYSVMYRQLTDLMGKTQEAEKSNAVYDFLKEGF